MDLKVRPYRQKKKPNKNNKHDKITQIKMTTEKKNRIQNRKKTIKVYQ